MNVIGIIVVNICINAYGMAYFDLHTFPDWAAEAAGKVQCGGVPVKATQLAMNATTTAVASLATTLATNLTKL